jgi:hypothetical protein
MTKTGQKFFALALALLGATALLHGQKREQTTFSATHRIENPVTLSFDVVKAVLETEQAKNAGVNRDSNVDASHLLTAAELHLGKPDDAYLVVAGKSPFSDADKDWYWILRITQEGPKVVLWADCNTLEVLKSRTNGVKDIRASWSVPSKTSITTFHFDGNEYKVWKQQTIANPY